MPEVSELVDELLIELSSGGVERVKTLFFRIDYVEGALQKAWILNFEDRENIAVITAFQNSSNYTNVTYFMVDDLTLKRVKDKFCGVMEGI